MSHLPLPEFADRLNEIFPVLMKEFARHQENELYKGKITLQQFLVLNTLALSADSKMKDLAAAMHVTTAAMTGLVERLVRERYASRAAEPGDRRVVKIQLTQKGSQLVKKINQQRKHMFTEIFGKISESDRQEYLRILRQIKENLLKDNLGS